MFSTRKGIKKINICFSTRRGNKMSDRAQRTQSQIQKEAGPIAYFVREQRKKLSYSQEDWEQPLGTEVDTYTL